ncbi:DNA/RNA non-specific endonuclease [Acinetobacter sp. 1125_18A]|uniref:DNA/RNA non-specific endonuclease n=1 Tax=Acinetobacter sp. 1125_18A TaxID=2605959 RepID=UPI00405934C5
MKFSFYLILFSVCLNTSLVFAKGNLNDINYSEIVKKRPIELYNNNQKQNSFDSCTDLFPKENPKKTTELTYFKKFKWGIRELCSDNFAVLYADRTKTPLLVIEKLSAKQLKNKSEGLQRTDFFFSDPRTPTNGRAKASDYKNVHPSVDRGHLASAGNAITPRGMAQTFALSNIFPQDSDNNRGPWRKIEADVRKYISRSDGDIYILSGLIFDKQENSVKVGKNKVWKPSRIFKLVYNPNEEKVWVYLMKNESTSIVPTPISYEKFVDETGVKFGFIDNNKSSNEISDKISNEKDILIENIKSKLLEFLKNFIQTLIMKIFK